MSNRREFLLSSIATGIAVLSGGCATAPEIESIRALLRQTVGTNEKIIGMVGVVVDDSGTRSATFGSSGVQGLALNNNTAIEIMSITKVLTALILVDMERRGEVAFDDPVAKYLPASLKLHENGGPITLLDLASYTSGLPNMPDNLPPHWWDNSNALAEYTENKLYEFLMSYMPKYKPGTHYEYTNVGFGLLGIALARRAGKSYEELLIERVCKPLGLSQTRITLTEDMQKHMVQPHNLALKPWPLWNCPGLTGAGAARSSIRDVIQFLKVSMRLKHTPLDTAMARLIETRKPTPVAGTQAALGWYITASNDNEIVWKTGLSNGCNIFIGYSTRSRRGAIVFSNFIWQPIDEGTTKMGMKMIDPRFDPGNLTSLYVPVSSID